MHINLETFQWWYVGDYLSAQLHSLHSENTGYNVTKHFFRHEGNQKHGDQNAS